MKNSKRTPKRYLFHGILSDTPISEEDTYYTSEYLQRLLKTTILPGIRILSLRVTELPERPKKTPQNPPKPE